MPRLRAALLASFLTALSAAVAPGAGADPADTALATVGGDDAAAVVDVYEDYLCPYSAAFEREFGDRIARATASGKLQVRYHMLHFLDPRSASGDYSSRAAGAASALFQHDPEDFAALHKRLFAKGTQPKEHGASDLSDDQLAAIAQELGADDSAVTEIRGADETAAAHDAGERSAEELRETVGKISVPTVVAHGKKVDLDDKNWLSKLVG
ncbi:MAG: DsbA family protein [Segniliparus sp.]|uniref:DsbA family protein n=1 Tax=Segniliparus sp. TaxID=2804064 RepID=UPI003F2F7915